MAANLARKYLSTIPKPLMRRLFNLWPPYLGAGVRVTDISDDFRYIRVELPLTWYNKNYVGVQFGGSLYAMTDPFYMFQLIEILGPSYIVWDKGALIDFKKPGKGTVFAEFQWTDAQLEDVRSKVAEKQKYVFDRPIEIKDSSGQIIATIEKKLYVRKKDSSVSVSLEP